MYAASLRELCAMKKRYSVRTILWVVLFSTMTLVFIFYLSYYVFYESAGISSRATESLDQQVVSVLAFTDSELSSLDTVMQNVAYSNLVKEYYLANLKQPVTPENGNYSSMQNAKVLSSLITAIIGPNRPIDQIYLYALDKGAFGVGLDNRMLDLSVGDTEWYRQLLSAEGNKIMFLHRDEGLSKYYTYEEGSWFLTLCSVYQNNYYQPIGVIEVMRSVTSLQKKLKNLDHKVCNESVYLYDPGGRVVYASGDSDAAASCYRMFEEFSASDETGALSQGTSSVAHYYKDSVHLYSGRSGYSGFTAVAAVSNKDLYAPLFRYLRISLFFFFAFMVLIFFLCRFLAGVISTPLTRMYDQLVGLYKSPEKRFETERIEKVETNLIELDTMYTALVDMQGRIRESMNREILLKDQELQSHMLALQSQMNPHFLYNSLATMQSLADEENSEAVVHMCQMISRMLRYISSDKEPLVTIRKETDHVKDYLGCMKMRYEEDLEYEIRIPEEMMELEIPKLCLQMIIENAIKYSTKSVRPPWRITVEGMICSEHWEIITMDNGSGFSDSVLHELQEKIRYIDETELLPSLEIDGMGLMNIYIRLRIFYGGKHVFRIMNRPEGGAAIAVGSWFSPGGAQGIQAGSGCGEEVSDA